MKKQKVSIPKILLILSCTYVTALVILKFGHMNPLVVALMPCLALSYSAVLKK